MCLKSVSTPVLPFHYYPSKSSSEPTLSVGHIVFERAVVAIDVLAYAKVCYCIYQRTASSLPTNALETAAIWFNTLNLFLIGTCAVLQRVPTASLVTLKQHIKDPQMAHLMSLCLSLLISSLTLYFYASGVKDVS